MFGLQKYSFLEAESVSIYRENIPEDGDRNAEKPCVLNYQNSDKDERRCIHVQSGKACNVSPTVKVMSYLRGQPQ
jgi:hypothetical protein